MTKLETFLRSFLRSRETKRCSHCTKQFKGFKHEFLCSKCEGIVKGNIKRGLYKRLKDVQ